MKAGERIAVRLAGELIEAEVRWARQDKFGVQLEREIDAARFTFAHKSWETANRPLGRGHVFDQFKPVSDFRRPGLKVR